MSVKICGSVDLRLEATTISAGVSSGADNWVHLAGYFDAVIKKSISRISIILNNVSRDFLGKERTVTSFWFLQERSACGLKLSMGLLAVYSQINPFSERIKRASFSLSGSRLLNKVRSGYVNVINLFSAFQCLDRFEKKSKVLQPWKRFLVVAPYNCEYQSSHGNAKFSSPCL